MRRPGFARTLLRHVALLLCVLVPLRAEDIRPQRIPAGTSIQDLRKILPQPTARKDALTDAGDFLRMPDGREIRLLRAAESAAVAFTTKAARDRGIVGLKSRREIPAHREAAHAQFRKGNSIHIVRAEKAGTGMDPKALQAEPSVAYARHVLVDPKSHTRMIATDEIIAAFPAKTTPVQMRALATTAGLQVVARAGNEKLNAWRLRLVKPKTGDPLQIARTLAQTKGVVWAQPNFLREIKHCYTPPNPLFATQQALSNLGLNHATAGADVKATTAWEKTTGNSGIVIAIIDDGVEITHPGLRIFTNPGESGGGKETNTLDDDANGFADDLHGWDFANNDNNASPVGANGHGTGTAGVAGGIFSAAAKTAGIAGGCTILPVKIADDTGDFTTDAAIGTAIIYASTFADVLSNSWGGGSESPFINAAIDYAVEHGRGGKGCPVFFATGNSASTWMNGGGRVRLSTAGLNGSYFFGFYYGRNAGTDGEETIRIDNVCVLGADGYTHRNDLLRDEDFESWISFGQFIILGSGTWQGLASTGVTSYWTFETVNALKGTGGIYSAASPQLTNGQASVLITPPIAVTGTETVAFSHSFSMSADSDFYVLLWDGVTGIFTNLAYGPWHGPAEVASPDTIYPASYVKTIAVGASNDTDRRSDYSCYAGHLDFLAPSNGGWNDIATLDPVGAVGWTPEDYKMMFGGTSSAAPLAAGIAALMLSVNPTLTENEIRTILRNTCDKIGGVTYVNGTHPEYGYGRVNAARAVESAMPSLSVNDVTTTEGSAGAPGAATFTVTLSAATVRDVTVDWNTTNGTALAGTNFTAANGTLTLPAGTTSAQVSVNLIGGVLGQPSVNFFLHIANATNATIFRSNGKGTITALDSDRDGMPDYWEIANGFDKMDLTDAALDADNDGLTNVQEFLGGTNPRDATDPTRILGTRMSGSDFFFTFKSVAGHTYRIEYKDQLTDPAWQPLGTDIPGTGTPIEIPDPGIIAVQPSRFYRARVLPQP
jgi:subtilisin family serine protease